MGVSECLIRDQSCFGPRIVAAIILQTAGFESEECVSLAIFSAKTRKSERVSVTRSASEDGPPFLDVDEVIIVCFRCGRLGNVALVPRPAHFKQSVRMGGEFQTSQWARGMSE